nr:hypothetical protein [uncultured bacterium]
MPVDLANLMQNVHDYFLNLYSVHDDTGDRRTFVAFERIGLTIPLSQFKRSPEDTAFSPDVAAERVAAIVNSMTGISADAFGDTPMKVDDFYDMLLIGATPRTGDEPALRFFADLLAQAKKDFSWAVRASMFLGGPQFHQVQTTPSDWFDADTMGNWTLYQSSIDSPQAPRAPGLAPLSLKVATWKLDLDLSTIMNGLRVSPLIRSKVDPTMRRIVSEDPALTGSARQRRAAAAARAMAVAPGGAPTKRARSAVTLFAGSHIDLGSKFILEREIAKEVPTEKVSSDSFKMSFQYCMVKVDRPWLYQPFLQNQSWYVPGHRSGTFSDGRVQDNSGQFPAMPVAFIAIKDLSITANWSIKDADKAQAAAGLGPFSLAGSTFNGTTLSSTDIQIIGWICTILPTLPPATDPALPK